MDTTWPTPPIGHCPVCGIGWLFWRYRVSSRAYDGVECGRWACSFQLDSWADAKRNGARPIKLRSGAIDPPVPHVRPQLTT